MDKLTDISDFAWCLIYVLEHKDRDYCIKWLNGLPNELTISKKILHYLLEEEDYPNCIRAVIEALNAGTTSSPMHDVAVREAHNLAKVLIDYGVDPNVRHDYRVHDMLKQALPLQVVLESQRVHTRFNWNGSVFTLICKMCTHEWRPILETVRVLALHTKELDQEIVRYTKEGKVPYLCALMFLGYYPRIPSVVCFDGDETTKEQMWELVGVSQRIGDKLQAYIRIPRSVSIEAGRVVRDISSLFKDACLTVKSIDTIMYHPRKISVWQHNGTVGEDNGTVGEDNVSLRVNNRTPLSNSPGLQGFNGSDMVHNITLGSRSLHTTSITKVHKDSALFFPRKGYVVLMSKPCFWKNSSFWMMALRKAVRHF